MKNYFEKIEKIDASINKLKITINERISFIINLLKEEKYKECYIELLSFKQELTDLLFIYKNISIAQMNNYIEDRRKRINYYIMEYDYRLDKNDRNHFIESDLKDKVALLKRIDNFIEYIKNNISILENTYFIVNNMIKF